MVDFDLVKIENDLIFMFNAITVDIDQDGVFATFAWDAYDETRCFYIKDYFYNQGLKDASYDKDEDGLYVVYAFFNDFDTEYPESINALFTEDAEQEVLAERKTVLKVKADGSRRRKVVCGKGKKFDGKRCVTMSSSQKLAIKKGRIKAKRTNKAKGAGKKRRTAMLRKRALKKRG